MLNWFLYIAFKLSAVSGVKLPISLGDLITSIRTPIGIIDQLFVMVLAKDQRFLTASMQVTASCMQHVSKGIAEFEDHTDLPSHTHKRMRARTHIT